MTFEVCGSGANKRHLSPQKQGKNCLILAKTAKILKKAIFDENSNKQVSNDL